MELLKLLRQVVGCSEGKHLPLIQLQLVEVSSEHQLNQQLQAAFLVLLLQVLEQWQPRQVDYLASQRERSEHQAKTQWVKITLC